MFRYVLAYLKDLVVNRLLGLKRCYLFVKNVNDIFVFFIQVVIDCKPAVLREFNICVVFFYLRVKGNVQSQKSSMWDLAPS